MNDNIIQQARDALAKWRARSTAGPWVARADTPTMSGSRWTVRTNEVPGIRMGVHEYEHGSTNLDLIVGTAGNPDLLDALDRTLLYATFEGAPEVLVELGKRIAATIAAADKRMTS